MGKSSTRKLERRKFLQEIVSTEGKFQVSFIFDGKLYTTSHQLTSFEVRHMKDLCIQHGDVAADQIIWKTAVKGIGMVAENLLAKAALEFIKTKYRPTVAAALPVEDIAIDEGKPE